MKKLSATFRRNKSGGVADITSPITSARSSSDDGLVKLTSAYERVLQEHNRQVVELNRLRVMADKHASLDDAALPAAHPRAPLKGRSKTFSAGTPTDENTPADIPFFQAPAADANGVRSVKGRPAWQRAGKRKNSRAAKPPPVPVVPDEDPAPRRLLTAPSFEPSYARNLTHPRQHSFPSAEEDEAPVADPGAHVDAPAQRAARLAAGKRWKAPRRSSDGGAARPMSSLPGRSHTVITQRRDRVEALPLASACAHLEAEIFRMCSQLDDAPVDSAKACCCRGRGAAICECGHRVVLAHSVDRLLDVLSILEDRYDSIEQYYVKGKEYAHAMGKFYQVSPSEYTRWVEERKSSKTRRPQAR